MIDSTEQALEILAGKGFSPPKEAVYQSSLQGMSIQRFMATQCYLEKNILMPTYPHVDLILDIQLYPEKWGYPHFFTILYSTIKKSIKTTISGIIIRWVSETWPGQQECICLASDAEQSKGRGYEAFRQTIEKHPNYDGDKRILYGPGKEKLWTISDRKGTYFPTNSVVKPVSSDFAGEAGGNPTVTAYTELWAWRLEKDQKLYAEMTVPPTRPKGFRFIDTYAGYRGVSNVLWTVWQRLVKDGRRITADEPFGIAWNTAIRAEARAWGFPEPDIEDPPIYIHLPSRTIGYIDQGVKARRFPWQLGEAGAIYYQSQKAEAILEGDYHRLHDNVWAEPVESLMPIEWWDNCSDLTMRPLNRNEPVVLGIDASVIHDCTAISVMSRHPEIHHETALRNCIIWDPEIMGGEINYDRTILPALVEAAEHYNIISVAYDQFQLKYLMDRVATGTCGEITMPDGSIKTLRALPVRPFNQQGSRREADSMFVTMVRDRQLHHDGSFRNLRDQITQAAGRHDIHENTKLHIDKLDNDSKIDGVISTAMANHEIMRYGI